MSKFLLREKLRAVVLLVAVVVFDGDKVGRGDFVRDARRVAGCASGSGGCLVI